eukprot:GCRY01003933.1.p1 GENE.GCRY01003933.1~~GCRY01003933.1.p1  ORF type:complete len:165 (+),score=14.38 GCRY01003933.1:167-661(+)
MEVSLFPVKSSDSLMIEQIKKIEKKLFPKHESVHEYLEKELNRKRVSCVCAACHPVKRSKKQPNVEWVVIGYAIYETLQGFAYLSKIAVAENYRREKTGTQLLQYVIDCCLRQHLTRLSLNVDPNRHAAVALYQKYRFEKQQLLKDYYCPGRDALQMSLNLISN